MVGSTGTSTPRPDQGILDLIEAHRLGRLVRYRKHEALFCEGQPDRCAYAVRTGTVKISCVSLEGRAYTYGIARAGHLLGLDAMLLGGEHEATAQALEPTEAFTLWPGDLDRLLSLGPPVVIQLLRQQVEFGRSLARQTRALSLYTVEQRLKYGLLRLADQYGLGTGNAVKLSLKLTHQEIADLIAADRATITIRLNELRKQGYIWTEERHLVMVPPEHIRILDGLSQAVLDADAEEATRWAQEAVAHGVDPFKALDALVTGIRQVDRLYAADKRALMDVVGAAFALKEALPAIQAEMNRSGVRVLALGTIVLGTVGGDIHDMGKMIVAMLLAAEGFDVIDLGIDVPQDQFVAAVREHHPDILGLSSLLTTTTPEIGKVIRALQQQGLRNQVKVIIGGAATSQELADHVGADGYAPTAQAGVDLAKRMIGRRGNAPLPVG